FANVELYRQDAWLASSLTKGDLGQSDPVREVEMRLHIKHSLAGEPAPFTIVAASDAELPAITDRAALGDPFEVRWWHEQLAASTSCLERTRQEVDEQKSSRREMEGRIERLQAE